MRKRVQYQDTIQYDMNEVTVVADMYDDESPIGFKLEPMEHTQWMSVDDAKTVVKAINAALKELK